MVKKLFILNVSIFLCFITIGQNSDTIVFSIDIKKYEEVARKKLYEKMQDSFYISTLDHNVYRERDIHIFSIPVFEWNDKAQEYTCKSHEKLERLISFIENPHFQNISFYNDKLQLIGGAETIESENVAAKRIRDSIAWCKEIPDMPFYFLRPNPFPLYDIIQEKQAYKYHLKHPDAFIFLIAYYEGFWVIKNCRLYKLKNNTLKNANQFFYMSGEEYIRDIASGDGMRVGYRYKGCFNANDAQYWSKQGNNIFMKLINQK